MRLRGGEILLGVASLALGAVLFLDWFETKGSGTSGWSGLSLGVLILLGVAICLAASVLIAVQRQAPIALTVVASVVGTFLTIVAAVALLIDVVSVAGGGTQARWPAVAGIVFAGLMALGIWRSMGDERLDAPESAYTQPEARSIPDA
jgi:hypothetical protein